MCHDIRVLEEQRRISGKWGDTLRKLQVKAHKIAATIPAARENFRTAIYYALVFWLLELLLSLSPGPTGDYLHLSVHVCLSVSQSLSVSASSGAAGHDYLHTQPPIISKLAHLRAVSGRRGREAGRAHNLKVILGWSKNY